MRCPNCDAEHHEEDMYCRHCGTDLVAPSTSIISIPSNLPAVLQNPQLPRRVAAGVGALALGFGLELLRRSLLARLQSPRSVASTLPALTSVKDILSPHNTGKPVKLPKGYEVHETVIVMRRVIRRG